MTDIETVCDLLTRTKIPHGRFHKMSNGVPQEIVRVDDGYPSFYTEFVFDPSTGALLQVAAWE